MCIRDSARTLPYDLGNNYTVQIVEIQPGSLYIPEDVVSINAGNITEADDQKSVEISGFASVKKIRVTVRLEKDILRTADIRTDLIYSTSNSPHRFQEGEIIFTAVSYTHLTLPTTPYV